MLSLPRRTYRELVIQQIPSHRPLPDGQFVETLPRSQVAVPAQVDPQIVIAIHRIDPVFRTDSGQYGHHRIGQLAGIYIDQVARIDNQIGMLFVDLPHHSPDKAAIPGFVAGVQVGKQYYLITVESGRNLIRTDDQVFLHDPRPAGCRTPYHHEQGQRTSRQTDPRKQPHLFSSYPTGRIIQQRNQHVDRLRPDAHKEQADHPQDNVHVTFRPRLGAAAVKKQRGDDPRIEQQEVRQIESPQPPLVR